MSSITTSAVSTCAASSSLADRWNIGEAKLPELQNEVRCGTPLCPRLEPLCELPRHHYSQLIDMQLESRGGVNTEQHEAFDAALGLPQPVEQARMRIIAELHSRELSSRYPAVFPINHPCHDPDSPEYEVLGARYLLSRFYESSSVSADGSLPIDVLSAHRIIPAKAEDLDYALGVVLQYPQALRTAISDRVLSLTRYADTLNRLIGNYEAGRVSSVNGLLYTHEFGRTDGTITECILQTGTPSEGVSGLVWMLAEPLAIRAQDEELRGALLPESLPPQLRDKTVFTLPYQRYDLLRQGRLLGHRYLTMINEVLTQEHGVREAVFTPHLAHDALRAYIAGELRIRREALELARELRTLLAANVSYLSRVSLSTHLLH